MNQPFTRRFFVSLVYSLLCITAFSQLRFPTDSVLRVLSQEEFLNIVRSYHPIVRQGNLVVDRANAELVAARAGFDPLLYASSERKVFDGKNYYDWFHAELKMPTWYGIELKAGIEENLGDLLNTEVTPGKSSYLGLTVPIAKNLLMDKRRAILQQAKVFREQSKAERSLIINDLLLDASYAYWTWVREYALYRVLHEAVMVNDIRFGLVKLGYRQGDRPAIDTTEALAQLQGFQLSRNDAWLRFRSAGLELSNYMWRANDTPYYLPPAVVPDTSWNTRDLSAMQLPVLDDLLLLAQENHPKLQSFNYKLKILEIDKRLKFQDMLPMFNLNYNLLNSGYNVFKDGGWNYYENNYKFGFDIGMPLRLSQGRGQYRTAKIKIENANLDIVQTRLLIENKIRNYFNELAVLQGQVRIAEDNLENYQRLFRGEDTRFRVGESTLFLLNQRENKVLEARQKLLELKTKLLTSYIALQWSTGQLR